MLIIQNEALIELAGLTDLEEIRKVKETYKTRKRKLGAKPHTIGKFDDTYVPDEAIILNL